MHATFEHCVKEFFLLDANDAFQEVLLPFIVYYTVYGNSTHLSSFACHACELHTNRYHEKKKAQSIRDFRKYYSLVGNVMETNLQCEWSNWVKIVNTLHISIV